MSLPHTSQLVILNRGNIFYDVNLDTMIPSLIQQVLIGHFQLLVEREEKRKAQLKAAYDRWAAKSKEMHSKTYMVKKKEFDILD
jgi:hypothetical protein